MRYLITLKALEPFMFGGDQTFGTLGDKEAGSYLVKSRMFPQQTAILGMLRKELMVQAGLLTRKLRGEWVDPQKKANAAELVGTEKFDMLSETVQDLGCIKRVGPVFLRQEGTRYLKKADIDTYPYKDGRLEGYDAKKNIYDNFVSPDGGKRLTASDIFKPVEQTGNKKGGEENALFKKTAYLLKDGFTFAFYADLDVPLKDGLVMLGADRSSFMMKVTPAEGEQLDYTDGQGHLTLLSDAYITLPIKEHCRFAVTSEISHRNLTGKKYAGSKYDTPLQKSDTLYLYEKGSVFIEPTHALIEHLKNENLQQIGYNIYTIKGETK
jgi:CRISPR-associated protein Cmr3